MARPAPELGIKRDTVTSSVAASIRQRIISGELPGGLGGPEEGKNVGNDAEGGNDEITPKRQAGETISVIEETVGIDGEEAREEDELPAFAPHVFLQAAVEFGMADAALELAVLC